MKSLKMYPVWFFLGFIMAISTAVYAAKVITPINNQTPTSIAGADSDNNIVPIRVNPSGNIYIQDSFGTISASQITITGNGATQRTQGSTMSVFSCTFQAIKKDGTANTGFVYAGGSTVTNAAGANTGFPLKPGAGIGPVSMSNLNQIYFAADNANDNVAVFCN